MSPRKSRHKVPKWIVDVKIKKKRRELAFGPYDCPKCKNNTLRIQMDKERKEVVAVCTCGLKYSLKYVPVFESVDYYNKLIDQWALQHHSFS